MSLRSGRSWRNWAGNQSAVPAELARPRDEREISEVIARAATEDRVVRTAGSGHSFTDTAVSPGTMMVLDAVAGVVEADRASGRVVVRAGTRLQDLNSELAAVGLALPNLGDIDRQTVAGAIATSTHGTGIRHQSIAAAVTGFRLVTADGSVLECSQTAEPGSDAREAFDVGRVSLGALGVMSEVTLECVPAFNLHAVEAAIGVDRLLAELDDHVESTDHFEFYWVPHTAVALTKHNRRTTSSPTGRGWARRARQELVENGLFGLLNRVGRRFPTTVPRLVRAAPASGRTEYVAPSHEVFCSRRRVRFVETEWAVPREAATEALQEVRGLVDRLPHPVSFPVEVRFLGRDDIPLSTAAGRDTAYIACHAYVGTPHEVFFDGVEEVMWAHGGRPHWGKLHRRTARDLRTRYPDFDRFVALRDRLDPQGRFANAYLDRVIGPPRGRLQGC